MFYQQSLDAVTIRYLIFPFLVSLPALATPYFLDSCMRRSKPGFICPFNFCTHQFSPFRMLPRLRSPASVCRSRRSKPATGRWASRRVLGSGALGSVRTYPARPAGVAHTRDIPSGALGRLRNGSDYHLDAHQGSGRLRVQFRSHHIWFSYSLHFPLLIAPLVDQQRSSNDDDHEYEHDRPPTLVTPGLGEQCD